MLNHYICNTSGKFLENNIQQYLIQVFPSVKRPILMLVQVYSKGVEFSCLLPLRATTVASQGIIDSTIIVDVVACQD